MNNSYKTQYICTNLLHNKGCDSNQQAPYLKHMRFQRYRMLEIIVVVFLSYLLYDYLSDFCWHINGPTNWFGIANTIEIALNYEYLLDLFQKYIDKYSIFTFKVLGFPRYVVINDPKCVEYILKDNFDNFIKGKEFQANFEDLLGDGIFSMDGPKWKMQRQAAAKIFHVNNFRDHMIHVFNHHLKTVCTILQHSQQSDPVDFHGLMHRFTLDSFTEIGFGESVNSLKSKDVEFAVAFDGLQQLTNESFFIPKPVLFIKNLILGRFQLRRHYRKIIDQFSYKVIQTRLQKTSDINDDDLLSHFLKMKKASNETYQPQDLRNIVMNFIIAGRDTTAQALSWSVYELRNKPDIIDKIRKEVDAKISNVNALTYDDIKSLTYTTAVFMECLRLHPSVPKNIKYSVDADVLPDGTRIKANWGIAWSPYCMARTPSIWGKDCCELVPERFLKEDYDPTINFSFHAGPRTCLGMNMAILEAVATLATLYSKYDMNVLNKAEYNTTITLQMKHPLFVKVQQRSQ